MEELADWEEGRRFALGALPDGPNLTLDKRGGLIRSVGLGLNEPDVSLLFKNLDAAMLVFTTYMGTVQAAAEDRVLIRGDNSMALEAVRVLDQVEFYLLPGIILKKNFRRVPRFTSDRYLRKVLVYVLLVPNVLRTLLFVRKGG